MIASPIVLVPGLSGRGDAEFGFVGPMLARDRAVVTADPTATRTLDDAAAELAAIAFAQPSPPVVVGSGIGAVIALACAAHAEPGRLAGVVAVAGWLSPPAKLVAFAALWARLRAERSSAATEAAAQVLTSADGWESAAGLPADATTDALVALAVRADLRPLVHRILAPTLVVAGTLDTLATPRESRLLFATLRDARYAEVETGHAAFQERPAQLLALIDGFAAAPGAQPAGTRLIEATP